MAKELKFNKAGAAAARFLAYQETNLYDPARWEKLPPPFDPARLVALLPKNCQSRAVTIEILGAPTTIVNAIRKVLVEELPVQRMYCIDSPTTTDKYHLTELIEQRVASIPIQRLAPDAARAKRIKIDVVNQTDQIQTIRSDAIQGVEGLVNSIALFTLRPGCRFAANLAISARQGDIPGYGQNAYGINAWFRPLDVDMATTPATAGMSRHHSLHFTTNGDCDPKTLLAMSIESLLERLEICDAATFTSPIDDHFRCHIDGENWTLGEILRWALMAPGGGGAEAVGNVKMRVIQGEAWQLSRKTLEIILLAPEIPKNDFAGAASILKTAARRAAKMLEELRLSLATLGPAHGPALGPRQEAPGASLQVDAGETL